MLRVKTKSKEYTVHFSGNNQTGGTLNNNAFEWDFIKIKNGSFHIIKNNKSYSAEVVKTDYASKTITIKVNENKYEFRVHDKYDDLLKQMGLENSDAVIIKEVKAPMPGLVLEVAVAAGQAVKAGDTLLVLEAMKMENILKSPSEGIVKKVHVKKRDTVEKNTVLINFE